MRRTFFLKKGDEYFADDLLHIQLPPFYGTGYIGRFCGLQTVIVGDFVMYCSGRLILWKDWALQTLFRRAGGSFPRIGPLIFLKNIRLTAFKQLTELCQSVLAWITR